MFNIKGDIHDRYTLEFKIGYSRSDENAEVSDFVMDTWLFLPDSMNINQGTYTKVNFYRDFRAMMRLLTPVFTLEEIASPTCLPLSRLKEWCSALAKEINTENEKAYEHQIKMFCSIARSAYRDEAIRISKLQDKDALRHDIDTMVKNTRLILLHYRAIPSETGINMLDTEHQKWFRLGDEWLCRTFELRTYHLLETLKKRLGDDYSEVTRSLGEFLDEQIDYEKKQQFIQPMEKEAVAHNRDYLHRGGQLKKYVESDLYLTMPLFIALVVSYMFKDRIKELMRFWFAQKLGSKLYDFKTKLALSGQPIGWIKRGMDFVSERKLPKEVRERRGRTSELETGYSALREQVIIFRQRLKMYGKKLATLSHYPLHGSFFNGHISGDHSIKGLSCKDP